MRQTPSLDQMASILQVIGPLHVQFRGREDVVYQWYATVEGLEIHDGDVSISVFGNGLTPESAVEDLFREVVWIPTTSCVVSLSKRRFRWDGDRWVDMDRTENQVGLIDSRTRRLLSIASRR